MKKITLSLGALAALLGSSLSGQVDPSPHGIRFVTVADNVQLEVLDWGGTGRPVVLLAGLGNTAHIFDEFAPELTGAYHVFGITRRGYGASSAPASGYSADRLGDDVLAVIQSLKLTRPVLAGHSIGGEELTSVGSRFPEAVAGLIYLDSDNFFRKTRNDAQIQPLRPPASPLPTPVDEASFQAWQAWQKRVFGYAMPEGELRQLHKTSPEGHVGGLTTNSAINRAILAGEGEYSSIRVPVLALFALPHDPGPYSRSDPAARAAFQSQDLVATGAVADAFESNVPSARVVRLANAGHYLFLTNEADVLREVNAFLAGL